MKKIIFTIFFLTLFLTGCSPIFSDEDVFVAFMHTTQQFSDIDDASLIHDGYMVCSLIETAGIDEAVRILLFDLGFETEKAGHLMAGSVEFLCPEHLGEVRRFIRTN